MKLAKSIKIHLWLGRIWWKLQSQNFILKMYFLACAHYVVLITNQFWINWFFGKNVIFRPKNAFFGKKWLFYPLNSAEQQSCFRTFCLGDNKVSFLKKIFLEEFGGKIVRPIFLYLPPHFWPYFINFSHQTGSRQ